MGLPNSPTSTIWLFLQLHSFKCSALQAKATLQLKGGSLCGLRYSYICRFTDALLLNNRNILLDANSIYPTVLDISITNNNSKRKAILYIDMEVTDNHF